MLNSGPRAGWDPGPGPGGTRASGTWASGTRASDARASGARAMYSMTTCILPMTPAGSQLNLAPDVLLVMMMMIVMMLMMMWHDSVCHPPAGWSYQSTSVDVANLSGIYLQAPPLPPSFG